jgi:hypothetical protein
VFYILALALIGIASAGLNQKESVRYALQVAATSILFAVLLVTAGCASSGGTQTMTYVVTVTASGANAPTHSQQFTLKY